MRTEAEHTPIPWKLLHSTNVVADDRTIALCATAAGGPNAEQEPLINHANAAFIVRAVNAHDDLLAACKEVSRVLDFRHTGSTWETRLLDIVNAAIDQARGAK